MAPAVWEYATAPYSLTIHLAVQDPTKHRTLCGRSTTNMRMSDETTSGIAADCKTCRRVAAARNGAPIPET
jgi:hypothetical protein